MLPLLPAPACWRLDYSTGVPPANEAWPGRPRHHGRKRASARESGSKLHALQSFASPLPGWLCYNLIFIAAIATCTDNGGAGLAGRSRIQRQQNREHSLLPEIQQRIQSKFVEAVRAAFNLEVGSARAGLHLPTWRWATSLWRAVLSWPSSCARRPAKSPNSSFPWSPRWKEWSASPWPGPDI